MLTKPKILIAEISGKRPGDKIKRPTEKFKFDYDKVIISNNSEGYETDWDIVDVPDDFRQYYIENFKMSDSAYFAPMNRSYAIKFAKEHGYDYLIQLDDNIVTFNVKYLVKIKDDGSQRSYATLASTKNKDQLPNDMFRYMADVLQNTNVGMVEMAPDSASVPQDDWLKERYVYSAFMLDLKRVPAFFQGDFEDDIEYRLKLKQLNVPSVQIVPFHYSKTAQDKHNGTEDISGNREAYVKAGLDRGKHMSELYGNVYERGMSTRGSGVKRTDKAKFRHKIKSFKVGITAKNIDYLKDEILKIFAKYVTKRSNKIEISKTLPKDFIHIELPEEQRDELLIELVNLCILTNSIVVTGTDELWWKPQYVIRLSGENDAKNVFFNFLSKHSEIKWEESGSK